MKKSVFTFLILLFVLISTSAQNNLSKTLEEGSIWLIEETTNLKSLIIAAGASISAPEGKAVTLTVDGVQSSIKPGKYKGDVVLTVTDELILSATVFGDETIYQGHAAIVFEDGYVPEKSVEAAVVGGTVSANSAKDISITSVGEKFNGIVARGENDPVYTIDNPTIKLTGHGGNDFCGVGAAIIADEKADITVNNARIENKGAIRSAVIVKGESTFHCNDSYIKVSNGPLPDDYNFSYVNPVPGSSLMVVPWMLGITGNNRATNLIDSGTAYYTNSHIIAEAWGVLSTDNVTNVNLYATNCHIETLKSGYGSYADGSSNTFSGCEFDVTDYALIMTGGHCKFLDGCDVNSGRFGVMFHGSGDLSIDDCVFNTKDAVIQVKSGHPEIVVDNSELNSDKGIILQLIENDDPNQAGGDGGEMAEGGFPAGGAPTGEQMGGGAPDEQGGGFFPAGGAPTGEQFGGGMPGGEQGSSSLSATFKNSTLEGDIVSSYTEQVDLIVSFENTSITGSISTTTAEHAVGKNGETLFMQDSDELYYLIGDVTNTNNPTDDEFGVSVSLDGKSSWIIDETSYLTELTIAKGASILAPKGYNVSLTVDGKQKSIESGDYKGKIVLAVSKS